MSASSVKVSIGLPVYNGSRLLRRAVESLLGQTYQNIELIICDNASTDDTPAICREFARTDSRVQYVRNNTNIGSHRNHNRTVELSSGDYFMWSGHDDERDVHYVERCLEALEKDESLVLCYSAITVIDKTGKVIPSSEVNLQHDAPEPHRRFAELISMDHMVEPIYGLIRSRALRATRLFGQFADTDRVLLAELGLHGRFYRIDEPMLRRRDRTDGGKKYYPSRYQRTVWFEPQRPNMIVFPYNRQFVEYLRAIHRAPISRPEKRRCYYLMISWLRKHGRKLACDYLVAFKDLLRPLYYFARGKSLQEAREHRNGGAL